MIDFEHVTKIYKRSDTPALEDIDFHVDDGEFVFLVGHSGAGKSTLLKLILREELPTEGRVMVDGKDVARLRRGKVPFLRRQMGIIFQDFRLIPTMTVYENVAFAMHVTNIGKKDIKERVNYMLELVHLEDKAKVYPEFLSGGEQQRVALARALAIEPSVLLMDEPLSNLDAKLRVEMREVIKEIQNKLGITTVYVTHDQEEAMAVSDRIAVMNQGVIQQIGTPKNLYQRPSNLFVATFIGRTNVLKVEASLKADGQRGITFSDGYYVTMDSMVRGVEDKTPLTVSIRPEEFEIVPEDQEGIGATVEYSTFLGLNTHYFVNLDSGERVEIIQESRIDDILDKGSRIRLQVKKEKINLFTEDGSKSLMR